MRPRALLGRVPRLLVASPAYLARAGMPATPDDLASHSVILGPGGIGSAGWAFERDGRMVLARLEARLSVSMNEGAVAAAVAGLGIASTALLGCRTELASGTLVQVLADWRMELAELRAVFPAGLAATPAARAFTDHLASGLELAL